MNMQAPRSVRFVGGLGLLGVLLATSLAVAAGPKVPSTPANAKPPLIPVAPVPNPAYRNTDLRHMEPPVQPTKQKPECKFAPSPVLLQKMEKANQYYNYAQWSGGSGVGSPGVLFYNPMNNALKEVAVQAQKERSATCAKTAPVDQRTRISAYKRP
jgi:hypothetical protein